MDRLTRQVEELTRQVALLTKKEQQNARKIQKFNQKIRGFQQNKTRNRLALEERLNEAPAAPMALTIAQRESVIREGNESRDDNESQAIREELVEILSRTKDVGSVIEKVDCYKSGCLVEVTHASPGEANRFSDAIYNDDVVFSAGYRMETQNDENGIPLTRVFIKRS